jgi:hypothetical protein
MLVFNTVHWIIVIIIVLIFGKIYYENYKCITDKSQVDSVDKNECKHDYFGIQIKHKHSRLFLEALQLVLFIIFTYETTYCLNDNDNAKVTFFGYHIKEGSIFLLFVLVLFILNFSKILFE